MFLLLVLGPTSDCRDGEMSNPSPRGDQRAHVVGGGKVGSDGDTNIDGHLSRGEHALLTAKATLLGEHASDLLVRSLP